MAAGEDGAQVWGVQAGGGGVAQTKQPCPTGLLHDAELCEGNIQDSGHTSTYWHRVSWQPSRWGRLGSHPNWTWQRSHSHSCLWWQSYSWSAGGWCSAHTHVVTRCLSCGWNLRNEGKTQGQGSVQAVAFVGDLGYQGGTSSLHPPHSNQKGKDPVIHVQGLVVLSVIKMGS